MRGVAGPDVHHATWETPVGWGLIAVRGRRPVGPVGFAVVVNAVRHGPAVVPTVGRARQLDTGESVDLDTSRIRITHGKGGRDRVVPFPQTFRETLALHVADRRKAGGPVPVRVVLESPTPPAVSEPCLPAMPPPSYPTTCHPTGCGTSCSPGSAGGPLSISDAGHTDGDDHRTQITNTRHTLRRQLR